jgi:hypothetical protein
MNEKKKGKQRAIESENRAAVGMILLSLEPRRATSTTHDRAHKRDETVRIFCRRHRTDLVLYTEKKSNIQFVHSPR